MINERVVCKDGFSMSVQANSGVSCDPRRDNVIYVGVEVGYPSRREQLLDEYVSKKGNWTESVYGFVPANIIDDIIEKHGGMVSGKLPPMI